MRFGVVITFESDTVEKALAFRAVVDNLIHRDGIGQAYTVTLHKNTMIQDQPFAPWEIQGDTCVEYTP